MNTLKYKHFECFQLNIQPEKGYVEELNQNRMFQYVIAPLPLTFHLFRFPLTAKTCAGGEVASFKDFKSCLMAI